MNKKKPNTDISDIKPDENNKHILDNCDKIIRWIKRKFEEQEEKENKVLPNSRFIDLSNCIICTVPNDENPSMTNLSDIITENEKEKSLECFHFNGYGNNYYQEVSERVICKNSIIFSAYFDSTKFHKGVDFEGTVFRGYASFGNCLFDKHADFHKAIFSGNFDFSYSIFNDSVWFNNVTFDIHQVNFEKTKFKGEFKAQSIDFLNSTERPCPLISFQFADFHHEVDLSYTNFTHYCDFKGVQFHRNVKFFKTDFNSGVCFDNSEINGRIDFKNCYINIFNGNFVSIKSEAILRVFESSIVMLNLSSIHNNGVIILEDNLKNIEQITLKSAINRGMIEIENTEVQKILDRKTARVLKDAALKSGNNIDGLEYRKQELGLYKNEFNKYQKSGSAKSTKFLLRLNEISNNHGTDWPRGIGFTFIGWIISFLLFLFISRFEYIIALVNGQPVNWTYSQDISDGIKYLWSVDFMDTLISWIESIQFPSVWWLWALRLIQLSLASLIYILGKLLVGYGIYQTIAAFRKYGR